MAAPAAAQLWGTICSAVITVLMGVPCVRLGSVSSFVSAVVIPWTVKVMWRIRERLESESEGVWVIISSVGGVTQWQEAPLFCSSDMQVQDSTLQCSFLQENELLAVTQALGRKLNALFLCGDSWPRECPTFIHASPAPPPLTATLRSAPPGRSLLSCTLSASLSRSTFRSTVTAEYMPSASCCVTTSECG